MLTTEPTKEMYSGWKRLYDENHEHMKPNRKSGAEVDEYFRSKYMFEEFTSSRAKNVVYQSVMRNDYHREKLPSGMLPEIRTYKVGDIFVGIDLSSGFFHVECESIEKAAVIYDDLFSFRGLDEADLKNVFLVAEYVRISRREALPR